jgi:hypothetical protein
MQWIVHILDVSRREMTNMEDLTKIFCVIIICWKKFNQIIGSNLKF